MPMNVQANLAKIRKKLIRRAAQNLARGAGVRENFEQQLERFYDLLELGRVIPSNSVPVWLVFFDGEDQGNIPGWEEWALGARAFVETFTMKPRAVIVLDMVGDFNLNIHQEKQSDPRLVREIWEVAQGLGYGQYFLPEKKYIIMDDHVPFLEAGIPAVDIIDIEYRYWHTTHDTADKVSPQSLEIVGRTIQVWIAQQNR